jgi:hypothetical protein
MKHPGKSACMWVVLTFFLFLTTAEAFARSYVGGVVYTRDGRRIEVLQFLDPLKKDDVITGLAGTDQVKIKIGKLKEFNLLTSGVDYVYPHSKLITETGAVSLVYRDGKASMLADGYFEKGTLGYVVMNSRGKREESKIKLRDLMKIQFESSAGDVRVCPINHAVFPDDYVFCPYHGVPLIWGEPKQ